MIPKAGQSASPQEFREKRRTKASVTYLAACESIKVQSRCRFVPKASEQSLKIEDVAPYIISLEICYIRFHRFVEPYKPACQEI